MAICWERAVLLTFPLSRFTLCRLDCLCFFPVWYLGQDVEFMIIAFSSSASINMVINMPTRDKMSSARFLDIHSITHVLS